MHPTDKDKIVFTTGRAIYYFKVMPFGLKNVEATFQRMVNKVFKELIRNTIEVYIDDMIVKSLKRSNHIKHLEEAFVFLQKFNVKLNPEKCTFGVASSKFLGFLVTQRGIEVNPTRYPPYWRWSRRPWSRKSISSMIISPPSTDSSVDWLISANPSSSPSRRTELTFVGTMSVRQHSEVWRLIWHPPTYVQATFQWNIVPLPSSLWHYSKCNSASGRWGHPKASPLC